MSERETPNLAANLAALQVVVKALARTQVKRSRVALDDLLDYLQVEADRLAVASEYVDPDLKETVTALDGWLDDLKREAALWDVEPADAGGRRVHFVD